jgi:hypothetical protein
MRLTPAQVAIHLICGHNLPMRPQRSLADNMKEGRAMLAQIANVDYGYDLQRWHDHLKGMPRSQSRGYTWNRTVTLPKVMQAALASDDWRSAARALAGNLSPNAALDRKVADGIR